MIPRYEEICNLLKLDREKDKEGADYILTVPNFGNSLMDILRSHSGREFFVIGNGPPVKDINSIYGKGIIVVADSAIWKIKKPYVPEIIVTDLDGDTQRILELSESGSIVFVHAHGDNLQAIKEISKKFKGRFIPTTQVPEYPGNFGGFTDGDRAAYISDYLGASKIVLVDFDFTTPHGKPWNERKQIKLDIARRLLLDLRNKNPEKIIEL
jgi:hypothetical protein